MKPSSKRWQVSPRLPLEAENALHGYPPLLRQILYNRGYATLEQASRFLQPDLTAYPPPVQMLGIPEARDRLLLSLEKGEPIAIYGDYDADGVTATALLTLALESLGASVIGYIPNRFDEGYGLNREALKGLAEQGIRLVITVDCGIRSLEEATYTRHLGMDLIISDHHHPGSELPQALSVINPKRPDDSYPEKDLAGVGLAYKLASALFACLNPGSPDTEGYLDLVALGTVADLAPLVGENRALVRFGIDLIRQPRRQGIRSLIGASGLHASRITASDLGFALGPRLNAAGRLESALAAFDLLTTSDVQQAGRLAQLLNRQNYERQQITRLVQLQAEKIALENDPDSPLLFAAHPEFNRGVVGLAASRLSELYYRPAIVAQIGEKFTRGSCRSIPEFHITEALDECSDLLEHHGGHAAAAGFTVHNKHLPEFISRLRSITFEKLASLDLRPTLHADAEITLKELKPDLLEYLEWLQPTGYGNRQAVFVSRNLKVTGARTVGRESNHLKLSVSDGRLVYDAIAFRQGHWFTQLPKQVDLMFVFEKNEYNGYSTLQLNVRDMKPSGMPD